MKYLTILAVVLCCTTAHAQTGGGFFIKTPTDMTHIGNISQGDMYNVIGFVMDALDKELCCGWEVILSDNFIVQIHVENGQASSAVFEGYTFFKDKEIHVYVYQPCLAASSLIHELGHAVGELGHTDKLYWENIENIQKEAIKKFCGKDYKVVPTPKISDELNALIILWIDKLLDRRSL